MRYSELLEKASLEEMHYSDKFPEAFEDFKKKYSKIAKGSKAKDLFIQFTNHKDNAMDRTAHQSPDHSDPVGVYGYPISYVLKHPADIWYGAGAKIIRVLERTNDKTLVLQNINSESKVENLLNDMGFKPSEITNMLKIVKKKYAKRISGRNKFAKMLMVCVQLRLDLEPEGEDGMFSKSTHPVRSGQEQTKLFLKAGYNAIEDQSKSENSAIINDREPEQIIFLNRGAFKVIDVIRLRGDNRKDSNFIVKNNPNDLPIERKFVSKICEVMDDKIKEGPERANLGGWSYYWTKKGRRVEIMFGDERIEKQDLKWDKNKKHRANKDYDGFYVKLKVNSEIGFIEIVSDITDKLSDILKDFTSQWSNLVDNPEVTDWKPQDKAGYKEAETQKRVEAFKKKQEEERKKEIEYVGTTIETINKVATFAGVPSYQSSDDPSIDADILRNIIFLRRYWDSSIDKEERLQKAFSDLYDDHSSDENDVLVINKDKWFHIGRIFKNAYEKFSDSSKFTIDNSRGANLLVVFNSLVNDEEYEKNK